MATVYLAEDLKHKRKWAVKVLRPEGCVSNTYRTPAQLWLTLRS